MCAWLRNRLGTGYREEYENAKTVTFGNYKVPYGLLKKVGIDVESDCAEERERMGEVAEKLYQDQAAVYVLRVGYMFRKGK